MLPPHISALPTVPQSPFPARASNPVTFSAAICFSSASVTTARARGCSLFDSRAYAAARSSSSSIPSAGRMSVTTGAPAVIVPVLSRTAICIFPVSSRDTAVLKRMPFFAPTPFPTMIATGVASPRAHGQLITSTDIPRASANAALSPTRSHIIVVTTAIAMTAGTNIPATLSAVFAMGAFVAAASPTIFIICESVVSSPTRVALHFRKPD